MRSTIRPLLENCKYHGRATEISSSSPPLKWVLFLNEDGDCSCINAATHSLSTQLPPPQHRGGLCEPAAAAFHGADLGFWSALMLWVQLQLHTWMERSAPTGVWINSSNWSHSGHLFVPAGWWEKFTFEKHQEIPNPFLQTWIWSCKLNQN